MLSSVAETSPTLHEWTPHPATIGIPNEARSGRLHDAAERDEYRIAVWIAPDGSVRCASARSEVWARTAELADATEHAVRPRVALGRNGIAAACWVDHRSRVCVRRSNGRDWGPTLRLSPSGSGSAGARLAIDSQQNIIVTWNDHSAAVRIVELDPDGIASGCAFDVCRRPTGYFPAVGAGEGAAVAYMGMDGAIWVVSRQPAGTWSDPQQLSESTLASFPSVAVDDVGRGVTTWLHGRNQVAVTGGTVGGAWAPSHVVATSDRLPWVTWRPGREFALHLDAPKLVDIETERRPTGPASVR